MAKGDAWPRVVGRSAGLVMMRSAGWRTGSESMATGRPRGVGTRKLSSGWAGKLRCCWGTVIVGVPVPPETRYARSGEVNIAYQVVGDGPVDVVYVPGWVSHVELAWSFLSWPGGLSDWRRFRV
jgi:hypothetical protein